MRVALGSAGVRWGTLPYLARQVRPHQETRRSGRWGRTRNSNDLRFGHIDAWSGPEAPSLTL